ncbi:hypothetical protein PENSPDRAFT_659241 [Peniophora sp. CONT]|nr:hypothetical protein PENSPDRAFT_659241 [Peniophora sp. CONT]
MSMGACMIQDTRPVSPTTSRRPFERQTAPNVTRMQTTMNTVAVHSCMAATTHTVPTTVHTKLMTTKHAPPGPCSQDSPAMANKLPAAPHSVAAITVREIGKPLLARVSDAAMIPQHTVTEYVVCMSLRVGLVLVGWYNSQVPCVRSDHEPTDFDAS